MCNFLHNNYSAQNEPHSTKLEHTYSIHEATNNFFPFLVNTKQETRAMVHLNKDRESMTKTHE